MICTNVKLLGLLPIAEWLNDTFRSGEPLTGPNGVLFEIGRARRPCPLFPNVALGHLMNIFGLLTIKTGH